MRSYRLWIVAVFFLLLLSVGFGIYWWYQDFMDHSQDVPIALAANHYGLDPALVKAVVWRESRFKPAVHGSRGEIGLMQIIPAAAAADWAAAEHITNLAPGQLEIPLTNTFAGAWYLQKLLHRYSQTDDPLPYALADYNAGRGNVLKWNHGAAATNSEAFIAQIGFPSTRAYVLAVTKRFQYYKASFPRK